MTRGQLPGPWGRLAAINQAISTRPIINRRCGGDDGMDAGVGAVLGTGQAAAPFVDVAGLRKSFGPVHALQGVSFSLTMGGTVSLLGPSGCGKTTVLRSIAG